MTSNSPKPDKMPWISPYVIVTNVEKSAEFYRNAFGFEIMDEAHKDESGKWTHVAMTYKNEVVMFGAEGAYGSDIKTPANSGVTGPINLYVYCDDVDALYQRVQELGVEVTYKIEDTFWGDRMFAVKDPDGHVWSFATTIPNFDPSQIKNN